MLEKGKKVGEYVLLEKLGAGGFGDVWKAEKRTVLDLNYFALKFFRPKEDKIDFDKIGKELAVWKQLRGLPHIISVIELDRFEDYVYVVSDFADGGSLENWLKNNGGKASSETEAVKIALEILTGLENLHGKNFVHRDLKPDNILIMNGRHCLADFGISREVKTHSKATGTAGTMEYMPPEAFEKTPSVTPQTDIWAVGAILQRLLTGKLPYPQDEQPSLIAAILMSEPDEMPASVSKSLREIIKKSLQKNREDRFQSANEMREILRDILKKPQRFLEEEAFSQADTIILEDLDKTEKYEIASIIGNKVTHKETVDYKSLSNQQTTPRTLANKAKALWIGGIVGVIALFAALIGLIGLISFVIWYNSGSSPNESMNTSTPSSNSGTFENSIEKESNKLDGGDSGDIGIYSPIDRNTSNSIGMEFVKILAGSFMMGSYGVDNETPVHKVTISKGFYLGKYEVTQEQYEKVMGTNPSNFKNCPRCPVEHVSWEDAQEFIKKLNAEGEGTYRLPTEAEWEYACRAGATGVYSGNLDEIAWYDKNSVSKTHPVGQKKANAWGLYDMHGNVWEWTADWYGTYSSENVTDPKGALLDSDRVFRGGSYVNDAVYLRSASRNNNSPSVSSGVLGFRVVRY